MRDINFNEYKLYVIPTERSKTAARERFFFLKTDYCLAYTDKELPEKTVEFENLDLLTDDELQWLYSAVAVLSMEYVRAHREKVTKALKTFTSELERELQKERGDSIGKQ